MTLTTKFSHQIEIYVRRKIVSIEVCENFGVFRWGFCELFCKIFREIYLIQKRILVP